MDYTTANNLYTKMGAIIAKRMNDICLDRMGIKTDFTTNLIKGISGWYFIKLTDRNGDAGKIMRETGLGRLMFNSFHLEGTIEESMGYCVATVVCKFARPDGESYFFRLLIAVFDMECNLIEIRNDGD